MQIVGALAPMVANDYFFRTIVRRTLFMLGKLLGRCSMSLLLMLQPLKKSDDARFEVQDSPFFLVRTLIDTPRILSIMMESRAAKGGFFSTSSSQSSVNMDLFSKKQYCILKKALPFSRFLHSKSA